MMRQHQDPGTRALRVIGSTEGPVRAPARSIPQRGEWSACQREARGRIQRNVRSSRWSCGSTRGHAEGRVGSVGGSLGRPASLGPFPREGRRARRHDSRLEGCWDAMICHMLHSQTRDLENKAGIGLPPSTGSIKKVRSAEAGWSAGSCKPHSHWTIGFNKTLEHSTSPQQPSGSTCSLPLPRDHMSWRGFAMRETASHGHLDIHMARFSEIF